MKQDEVWVGRFKGDGEVFLYDPDINSIDLEFIKLYMKGDEVLRNFNRLSIRTEVEKEQNETTIVITKSSYVRWKFRKSHPQKISIVNKQNKSKAARKTHRKDTRQNKTKDIRSTIIPSDSCYCGLPLDSIRNRRCTKCGWLICADGHCGCGYKRR